MINLYWPCTTSMLQLGKRCNTAKLKYFFILSKPVAAMALKFPNLLLYRLPLYFPVCTIYNH